MDYQVFLVRPPGSTTISGRPSKGVSRILRISENGIIVSPLSSFNAPALEYSFERMGRVFPSHEDNTELTVEMFDGARGHESVRFCCDSRTALLTALLNKMDDMNGIGVDFPLKKHSHQRGGLADTVLRIRSASIVKMVNAGVRHELRKVNPAKKINFEDIVKVETLVDDEHIVLLHLKSRVLRLSFKDSVPFLQAVHRNMKTYLNLDVEIERVTTPVMVENVSARLRKVRDSPLLFEFHVSKRLKALNEERRRTIAITRDFFLEKNGEEVIGVHSLNDVVGLTVDDRDPTEVTVEFKAWRPTQYYLEERDDLLASMADVMGVGKGSWFSLRMEPLYPYCFPEKPHSAFQNECETYYLNRIIGSYYGSRDPEVLHVSLKEYAANIHVGDSQCGDPKIAQAVADILKDCLVDLGRDGICATTCCIVLQRLLASRACFDAIRSLSDVLAVLLQCLRSDNSVLSYLASVAVRTCFKLPVETGNLESGNVSKQEVANKIFVLSAEHLQLLVALLHTRSLGTNNALQVFGLLEVFSVALQSQPAESEMARVWMKAFESAILIAADIICAIFWCPSFVVFQSNSLLLKGLLTKTSSYMSSQLQKICLGRCVLLIHLRSAIFSEKKHIRLLSGNLIYLMLEGSRESRKLLEAILPKGVMRLYAIKAFEMSTAEKERSSSRLPAWMETLEILQRESLETPVLVWNDKKRLELRKFLREELKSYETALARNRDLLYNSADVLLVYSPDSEGEGSVVGGVHLELLVDHSPPADGSNDLFWKLRDPLSIFQSVFQAMVLGFTPLFGHNNLPEIDLRLAAHTLSWIYDRHAEEVAYCLETLNVIEAAVGMLREIIETEHEVFVFKLVVFLLTIVESGGRDNVVRFIRAGGAAVLVPLITLSLAKCCKDRNAFESDGWKKDDVKLRGAIETIQYVGSNGEIRFVRVPSGRAHEVLERAVLDGSLDAKEAIKWQDEKVPAKVQLGIVLDLMEALLRFSGSDSHIEAFPPSAACLNLSREEILCHLVQALLRAKTPVFGRILDIITYLVKTNQSAMARLYKLGAFEILLWKLLAGAIVDVERLEIAKFLLQCHLLQDADPIAYIKNIDPEDHPPWRDSTLQLYLPEGMITKLMSEGPDTFTLLVDSEQDSPEVIWNIEMRQRLLDYLVGELGPYVKSRASDPMALYIHEPKPPMAYPELEDSVFAAPFYLHNLLDGERFPSYQINDPVGFLSNLMLELRKLTALFERTGSPGSSWRRELPRLHLLLHAQAYLLERFPQLSLPSDVEAVVISLATPALRICLDQKDEAPMLLVDILQHTTKTLRRYCAASSKEERSPEASLHFALSVLSLGTKLEANGTFPESTCNASLESAVAGSLFVLEQASSTGAGRELIYDDIRWKKGFWWALCSAAGDAAEVPPKGPSPVSFAALSCLKNFAKDDGYAEYILKQAIYLPLLLLAIPPEDATVKARDSKSALLYSAADVLSSLVCALSKAGGDNPSPRQLLGRNVMSKIIPEPLLVSLYEAEAPERFLSMVTANIEQPMAIWTGEVRSELRARVTERMRLHNAVLAEEVAEAGDDLEWLADFKFECLRDELVVGGLYVKGLASGQWETFDLPAGHSFFDAIQDYLEAHQNVIIVGSEQDAVDEEPQGAGESADDAVKDEAAVKYLTVLAALKECLKYGLRVGREDLLPHFRPDILSQLQLTKRILPQVQMEFASIIKLLVGHDNARDLVLQSELVGALTMQLWEATAGNKNGTLEGVVVASSDAFLLLSESIPANVAATNLFASTGVLLPLLALFCRVGLPSLRDSSSFESFVPVVSPFCRLLSAQILGQLLLAGSGVSRRVKLLNDLAQRKSFGHGSSNGRVDEGIDAATDMYELMDVMEPGSQREEPLVIKTLLLILPVDLLSTLTRDPSEACAMYDKNYLSPRLVWDDDTRQRVKATLEKEALKTAFLQKGLRGIPSWSLVRKRPVFLRWVLITVHDDEQRPLFRDEEEEGYARELYLGGFYVDQFLRNPQYDFGSVLEERFMREIRKAVVIGVPTDGIHTDEFDLDDRRRLLLVLLLLFKGRPALLSGYSSNIDIFLPLQDFISGGAGSERRALAQPAMLLFHCTAKHKDIVDCVISEELIYTLSSFLSLHVPQSDAGNAGTDPRLCSLMLLLRLMRLSHKTVEIAYKLGLVSKIADIVLDIEGSVVLRQRAAECLAIMCTDKRRGQDVSKLLDKLIPENAKGYGAWNIHTANIRDEVIDSKTLKHFLQHRYPSGWWVLDTPEGTYETDTDPNGPVTIVEATVTFPHAKMSDFNDEAEGVFRRSIATLARVEMRDVHILRKRTGSIIIDFEVYFQRSKHEHGKIREPEMDARAFKEKLESDSNQVFGTKFFEPMGVPMVTAIAIKLIPQLSRGKSWKKNTVLTPEKPAPTVQIVYVTGGQTPPTLPRNGSEKDVNVIYLQGSQTPEELLRASGVEFGEEANFVLQQQPQIVYQLPPGAGGTGHAQVLYRPPSGFVPPPHEASFFLQSPQFSNPESQLSVRSPTLVGSLPSVTGGTTFDVSGRPSAARSLPFVPYQGTPDSPFSALPPTDILAGSTSRHSLSGQHGLSTTHASLGESPELPVTARDPALQQPLSSSPPRPAGSSPPRRPLVSSSPPPPPAGSSPPRPPLVSSSPPPPPPSPPPPPPVASPSTVPPPPPLPPIVSRNREMADFEQGLPIAQQSPWQLSPPSLSLTGGRPGGQSSPRPAPLPAASNGLARQVPPSPPSLPPTSRFIPSTPPPPPPPRPVIGLGPQQSPASPLESAPSYSAKPTFDAAPFPSPPEASSAGHTRVSTLMVKSEEGRMVPLDKGLSLILEGADITAANTGIAIANFLEAFEEEPEELVRMIEKYPKLVQKYSLQPQLCYDLVMAWEEHCLDMLTKDELAKHGRSIAAFDMCRFDEPETATEEARRKYQAILKVRKEQEWKQKSKQIKGDMSAELTKAVSGRKEKLSIETAQNELKSLSTGKIKLKSKNSQSNLSVATNSGTTVTP